MMGSVPFAKHPLWASWSSTPFLRLLELRVRDKALILSLHNVKVNCDSHFPLDAITEGKGWLVNQEKY